MLYGYAIHKIIIKTLFRAIATSLNCFADGDRQQRAQTFFGWPRKWMIRGIPVLPSRDAFTVQTLAPIATSRDNN